MSVFDAADWTHQPQCPVDIEWRDPLARGLVFAQELANGHRTRDLVTEATPTVTVNSTLTPNQAGRGVLFANGVASVGAYFADRLPGLEVGSGDFTIATMGAFPTGSTAVAVPCNVIDTSTSQQYRLAVNHNGSAASAGAAAFITYQSAFSSVGANSVLTGVPQILLGRRQGSSHSLWVDGVKKAESTLTVRNVSTSASRMNVGNFRIPSYADPYGSGGNQLWVRVWNRALSDDEIVLIRAQPWRVLAADDDAIYLDTAVSGVITSSAVGEISQSASDLSTKIGTSSLSGSSTLGATFEGLKNGIASAIGITVANAITTAVKIGTAVVVGVVGFSGTVEAGPLPVNVSSSACDLSITGVVAASKLALQTISGEGATSGANAHQKIGVALVSGNGTPEGNNTAANVPSGVITSTGEASGNGQSICAKTSVTQAQGETAQGGQVVGTKISPSQVVGNEGWIFDVLSEALLPFEPSIARRYLVAAETRLYSIELENRTWTVDVEARTFIVEAEPRKMIVSS